MRIMIYRASKTPSLYKTKSNNIISRVVKYHGSFYTHFFRRNHRLSRISAQFLIPLMPCQRSFSGHPADYSQPLEKADSLRFLLRKKHVRSPRVPLKIIHRMIFRGDTTAPTHACRQSNANIFLIYLQYTNLSLNNQLYSSHSL